MPFVEFGHAVLDMPVISLMPGNFKVQAKNCWCEETPCRHSQATPAHKDASEAAVVCHLEPRSNSVKTAIFAILFSAAMCSQSSASASTNKANALPSAAAAVGVISRSPTVAFLSLPQEAPLATDGLLAYADDCADGSCSIVRGQPVRNVVRGMTDEDRPRLFSGRILRRIFNGRFRLFGGCRGCN